MARRPAAGFTLVELLVVITIIGLLAAIALPAIGTAREAARRAQCINNQRELAKAIQNYENKKQKYPPSFTNSPSDPNLMPPNNTHKWPWLPTVMPYIGEQALYDQLLTEPDLASMAVNPQYGNRYIQLVNCPSDPNSKDLAFISYTPNMGQRDVNPPPMGKPFRDDFFNGVFHDRWSDPMLMTPYVGASIDKTSIKDGEQYTVLLTENINARFWVDRANEFYTGVVWIPEDAMVNTNFTINQGVDDIGEVAPPLLRHARPSSNHQGGFVAAFCDGQVRWISEEISYQTYRQILSIDDSKSQYDFGMGLQALNNPIAFDAKQLEP